MAISVHCFGNENMLKGNSGALTRKCGNVWNFNNKVLNSKGLAAWQYTEPGEMIPSRLYDGMLQEP